MIQDSREICHHFCNQTLFHEEISFCMYLPAAQTEFLHRNASGPGKEHLLIKYTMAKNILCKVNRANSDVKIISLQVCHFIKNSG